MSLRFSFPADKPFDVVGFGFNTHDHVCVVSRPPRLDSKQQMRRYLEQPGGQIPTALVALQRWGLRTAYVGPFGDDEGGRLQRASLEREGVDVSGARERCGVGSHVSVIFVDEVSGERGVLWHRPEELALRPEELDRRTLTAGRVLFMDADDIDNAILAARWAKEDGVVVVLDVDAPGQRSAEMLALADVVVVPVGFPEKLTGAGDVRAALRKMGRMGPALVAVTLGRGGAMAFDGSRISHVPAFPVRAVDTTAAGDLFHAGCIYGLLRAWSAARTLHFAAAAAALECEGLGGLAAIPPLDRVQALAGRP
jgi:sugar/nucleoside kinase (ribokinase family)